LKHTKRVKSSDLKQTKQIKSEVKTEVKNFEATKPIEKSKLVEKTDMFD